MIDVPSDDIRSRLPEEVIRLRHPEVFIRHDGRRTIPDPASQRFNFTGTGAGSVKCGSPNVEAKCRQYAERYELLKQQARVIIGNPPRR
jgi:hypothetical protein